MFEIPETNVTSNLSSTASPSAPLSICGSAPAPFSVCHGAWSHCTGHRSDSANVWNLTIYENLQHWHALEESNQSINAS